MIFNTICKYQPEHTEKYSVGSNICGATSTINDGVFFFKNREDSPRRCKN